MREKVTVEFHSSIKKMTISLVFGLIIEGEIKTSYLLTKLRN
jgi:hypothetical protein